MICENLPLLNNAPLFFKRQKEALPIFTGKCVIGSQGERKTSVTFP